MTLSSEIATLISERYIEIPKYVLPDPVKPWIIILVALSINLIVPSCLMTPSSSDLDLKSILAIETSGYLSLAIFILRWIFSLCLCW